jgi:hypothetical protein
VGLGFLLHKGFFSEASDTMNSGCGSVVRIFAKESAFSLSGTPT